VVDAHSSEYCLRVCRCEAMRTPPSTSRKKNTAPGALGKGIHGSLGARVQSCPSKAGCRPTKRRL